jgi:DNA-binding SARP family transcriptional activator/tetratricopeptide (TPR) repeat protein
MGEREAPRGGLQVRVVGRVSVQLEPPAGLPAGRATRLLGLLAAYADDTVPTGDLVSVLWDGEAEPRDPSRVLASLVSRLRAALGPDRIAGDPRGYRFVSGRGAQVDLVTARLLLNTALAARNLQAWEAAFEAARSARALLERGTVLAEEPSVGPVQALRREAALLLRRAREVVWTAALRAGYTEVALDAATAAVAADPLDEAAVRAAMVANAVLGQASQALLVFQELRERMAEDLGADPSRTSEALLLALLRGDPPATYQSFLDSGTAHGTENLDPAALEVLGQAAVLGPTFDLHVLAALADRPAEELAPLLLAAQQAGLLRVTGRRFAFVDDSAHLAALAAQPSPVRAVRHRRAAQLLAEVPDEQARHWAMAGEHRLAALAWQRAAEGAADDPEVAEAVLGQALAAAEEAAEPRLTAELLLRRCAARVDRGGFDEARADGEAALAIARRIGDADLEARALEALGWAALHARDAYATLDFASRARELAESAAAAPQRRANALLLVGRVRHWDGDLDGADAAYAEAVRSPAGPAEQAVALAYRGALLEHRDDYVAARRLLDRAARACARTGSFRPLVQSLFFAAMARGNAGDLSGGLRLLGQARDLLDERGVSYYRSGIDVTAAWLWRELGDLPRARDLAHRALAGSTHGEPVLELEQDLHALLGLAECELALGRPEEAARLVERAESRLSGPLPFAGRARLRVLDVASRLTPQRAEELLAAARSGGSPKYQALALHRLGRQREALALAEPLGADLLLAAIDAGAGGRAARDRIWRRLPRDLRDGWAGRTPPEGAPRA